MLKNLKNVVLNTFRSQKSREVDEELLAGLDIEGSVDEPTSYAVLLMDLAMADGVVTSSEISGITHTIAQMFPARAKDCPTLVAAAQNILNSFRTQSMFVAKIKEEYSPEERQMLYTVIDKVIMADGFEDDMEKYLRGKFTALLA